MANADDEKAGRKVATIEAGMGDPEVHRFLQNLPIFRVDTALPQALEDKLRELEEAEGDPASTPGGRHHRGH